MWCSQSMFLFGVSAAKGSITVTSLLNMTFHFLDQDHWFQVHRKKEYGSWKPRIHLSLPLWRSVVGKSRCSVVKVMCAFLSSIMLGSNRLINTFPKEAITIPTTKDKDILPLNSRKTIPKTSIFQAGYIQKFILTHYAKCPDCTHHTWTNPCDDVSHIIVNRSQKLAKAGKIASQMTPKTNAIDNIPSLKQTFLPLKIDVWKMIFAFWKGECSGAMLIFRKISICVTLLLFHQPAFPWRGNSPARKKTTYRWRHATSLQFQSNMYTYINMYILVYLYTYDYISHNLYTHKYINM